jgi:hypothetical protein
LILRSKRPGILRYRYWQIYSVSFCSFQVQILSVQALSVRVDSANVESSKGQPNFFATWKALRSSGKCFAQSIRWLWNRRRLLQEQSVMWKRKVKFAFRTIFFHVTINFFICYNLLAPPSPLTSYCVPPLIKLYPIYHYFDTSRVPPGGRVPQVGNPCIT